MPINPAVSSDDAPDDLRASLMSSYDEAESALSTDSVVEPSTSAPELDETAPGAVATAPLPEEAAAPTPKADHPSDPKRYADGSFKPTKAATTDTGAPKTVLPSKDTQTQASAAAQTAVAPPAGWTAAEKATVWPTLSPAAQAAVSRREADMANGGKQWSEEKRRYNELLAPVAKAAQSRGMSAEQGLQTLLAAQAALDTNPVDAIKHIARSYGVDLATLAGTQAANGSPENIQQPTPAPQVYRDPRVDQIWQAHQTAEQQRAQQTVDLVTTFATSEGHEHFNAVEAELMAMIPTIKAANPGFSHEKVLQEAYDRAVYANPTTRAALQAAADAAAEAKRVETAKNRANQSRRAAVSVTGAPTGAPAAEAKGSLRAEIEAAFEGAGA